MLDAYDVITKKLYYRHNYKLFKKFPKVSVLEFEIVTIKL